MQTCVLADPLFSSFYPLDDAIKTRNPTALKSTRRGRLLTLESGLVGIVVVSDLVAINGS
jgi:hypothetical protein